MVEIMSSAFSFFNSVEVMGINITTWFVIVLVISAIVLFVRGNK